MPHAYFLGCYVLGPYFEAAVKFEFEKCARWCWPWIRLGELPSKAEVKRPSKHMTGEICQGFWGLLPQAGGVSWLILPLHVLNSPPFFHSPPAKGL